MSVTTLTTTSTTREKNKQGQRRASVKKTRLWRCPSSASLHERLEQLPPVCCLEAHLHARLDPFELRPGLAKQRAQQPTNAISTTMKQQHQQQPKRTKYVINSTPSFAPDLHHTMLGPIQSLAGTQPYDKNNSEKNNASAAGGGYSRSRTTDPLSPLPRWDGRLHRTDSAVCFAC